MHCEKINKRKQEQKTAAESSERWRMEELQNKADK
jgi:hypothetical protein